MARLFCLWSCVTDGAKDADLTATGKTEKKSVGNSYWNGAEQNFVMFTTTVPADFSGYKVHNGDRWFGENGTTDKTTAYIFNYSGDKALYEESAEPVTEAPTEPATVMPVTEPATDAPTEPSEKAYYLVGTMNNWTAEEGYKLSKNTASAENEEYLLSGVKLTTKDEIKIVYTDGNAATAVWFPDLADNYGANGEITAAGTYTVYFRPHYDGYEDWFNGCIAVINNSEPQPLLGDVDMDGDVDIQDATLLHRCLAEMTALNDDRFKPADVNQDGFVNVRDVTAIQRIVAEMS